MRFFNRLKKTENIEIAAEKNKIYAPLTGTYIPVSEVEDQVFSSGVLGMGCGIRPDEGMLYAPVTGTVRMIADTKHALGIVSEDGIEYLLHIGLDTVKLNGKGFEVKVKIGERVRAGQLLVKFDMQMIKKAGYSTTTVFVMTQEENAETFEIHTGCHMKAGDEVGHK